MNHNTKHPRRFHFRPEKSLLATIVILLCVFLFFVFQADQRDISQLADETITFLEQMCQRYDDYAAGRSSSDLNAVLNKTLGLAKFAQDDTLSQRRFLRQYVSELQLTGMLVTDDALSPVAQASTDGSVPAALLASVIANPSVQDILQHPVKTYAQRIELNGTLYDLAVAARQDGSPGLVIGYHDATLLDTDIYSVSLEKALAGNNFHKNPSILITDGTTILASNTQLGSAGQPVSVMPIQNATGTECHYDGLMRINYDHHWWYGKRQVFQNYYIYVFYPFTEVFTNMLPMVTTAIAIYALLCMLLMIMRSRAEQRHRETEALQLQTIRSLSKLFAGATVLHLQDDTFENISLAPRQGGPSDGQSGIRQAYDNLAQQLIAPSYQKLYLDFFDVDTMEQRLKDVDSASTVVEDNVGSWYSMYLLPLSHDKNGHLQDVLVASRNITEYQKKEEEYRTRLRKTAADAQIANEAKSLFLRRMSHDVRTPINGIRGMAVLARESLNDPAAAGDCIDKIILSTDYLHELLQDVLRMSKLESGSIQFENKPFDLQKLIAETADFIRVQADEKKLGFTLDTTGLQHIHVIGSPLHLRQVVQNILSNAVKFTDPGGEIRASFRETDCTADTMTVQFTCADTGIGINPEFRPKIFEPFAQENDSARTHYEGTGLGLAIAKQILDQRGGTIAVSSQKGRGSTFTVTLPLRLDASFAEAPSQQEAPISIEGVRILLVEDNEINLAVAQTLLEERGAVITAARDGQQAVDAFAAAQPGSFDIILMDIMMPVMDGYEATRAIRTMERPDAASIPIFAMTANAFVEDIEHCMQVGMDEHIAKPIDLDQMVRIIAKYWKRG